MNQPNQNTPWLTGFSLVVYWPVVAIGSYYTFSSSWAAQYIYFWATFVVLGGSYLLTKKEPFEAIRLAFRSHQKGQEPTYFFHLALILLPLFVWKFIHGMLNDVSGDPLQFFGIKVSYAGLASIILTCLILDYRMQLLRSREMLNSSSSPPPSTSSNTSPKEPPGDSPESGGQAGKSVVLKKQNEINEEKPTDTFERLEDKLKKLEGALKELNNQVTETNKIKDVNLKYEDNKLATEKERSKPEKKTPKQPEPNGKPGKTDNPHQKTPPSDGPDTNFLGEILKD